MDRIVHYKVRKRFIEDGHVFLPGDVLKDLSHYPRPEGMIRGGWLVEIDQPEEAPKKRGRPKKVLDDSSI